MARIGTKQNAAKEAPIVNRLKSPDFVWLNVDRYVNESAWLKQTAMSFGTNLTRKALRDLPFVRTFHLRSLLTVPQLEVARSRFVGA